MPSDQQTSAWLIVEMRGDATSIRLRSSPPSSPKARGIAEYRALSDGVRYRRLERYAPRLACGTSGISNGWLYRRDGTGHPNSVVPSD